MKNDDIINKYYRYIGDNEFIDKLLGNTSKKHKKKTILNNNDNTKDQSAHSNFMFQKSPSYISAQLRNYQIEGLNWLISMHEHGINCILADEMGLGKTIQTISLLGYLKYVKKENHNSHLIIVPKSTLQNWQNEFGKFLPKFKVKIFHSSKKECNKEGSILYEKNYDACITTYEMCLIARKILGKISWSYIIIDEAHRIKNERSVLSIVVRIFKSDHRLLLTGTPLQNNIRELWALLNFIIPEIFNNNELFEKWVSTAGINEKSIEKLRNVLKLFFLRREKIDVEKSLKPKKIIHLYAKLTDMQRQWYKMILKKDLTPIIGLKETRITLMNVIMQLRKCCNHPYLFPEAEPGPPYTTDVHLIENCGKMIVLDKLLEKLKENRNRVLLFSQMARMVDIFEDYCVFKGYKYCRIDGMTLSEDRIQAIEEFNKEDSDKFIFLLTTRAGGLGINLATADTVILYDTDWNPQTDLQAQDRAHRIGQKKQVVVYKFITENTIEEKIIEKSQQKLKLDEILIKKKDQIPSSLNKQELLDILATGVENIDENVDMDNDIDEIIRIGEEKTKAFEMSLEKTNITEANGKQINIYEFEGENYNLKKLKELFPVEKEQKRRKLGLYSIKPPEKLKFQFFQFYPQELITLQKKEQELFKQSIPLPDDEKKIKEQMMKQGFEKWTKKDFNNFVKAMCLYGRNNFEKILEMVNKDEHEVRNYYEVFWKRYKEIPNYNKIIAKIEKTEFQLKKNEIIKKKFEEKMKNNLLRNKHDLFLNTRSKLYSEDFDMFLLECYIKYCESNDISRNILLDVKKNPKFKFNYFIKTRSASEIFKRTNSLIKRLLKGENPKS